MRRILLAAFAVYVGLAGSGIAKAMPVQPVTVTLGDVPSTGPGPDAALIGTGTCTAYKKLYALKPARNGLSNTAIPSADLVKLFKTPHVVAPSALKYCGALKSIFLR